MPLQDLYYNNNNNNNNDDDDDKSKTHPHHHHGDSSEISMQDMYSALPSLDSELTFLSALKLAREKRKWFLLSIQSATLPVCGRLNREIWHHPDIANILGQSFIFLQLDNSDERTAAYFEKYYGICADNIRKVIQFPHIVLMDPVSGHRWKIWEGPGLPDKDRFLADLSEFEMVGEGSWCEWGKGVIGGEA